MKPHIHKIPFKEISLLSQTAKEYVYEPKKLSPFITGEPSVRNFGRRLKERAQVNRDLLVEELLSQNKTSNQASIANIELLRNNNTFTVTTGHQICLFTGPLYSLYKIISTLKLAEKLKAEFPENNFVPVFWMATEDHDFEEINHVFLGEKKLTWNSNQTGPVGRFSTNDMADFLKELNVENTSDLTKILTSFYKSSSTLAEAHNKVIDHLFGGYGIVILDADSHALKKEMIPIFAKELTERKSEEIVLRQSEELQKLGHKQQVTPREINLFYQKNGLRERIVFVNNRYQLVNTELSFSEKEILTELENHPERFSPNVVMRPMYQEKILPNLGYIGGPGELAYWLQLKEAFEFYQLDFPLLVLRNSALLLPTNIVRKINELPFELSQYFHSNNELIKQYVEQQSTINLEPEIAEIEKIFELTREKVGEIDFTLEKTVIAELKRAQNSMKKIRKKTLKAEKTNHSVALNRINKIKACFFPAGTFQERKSNLLEFYEEELIKNIHDNLIPLEDNLTLIELN